MDRPGLPEKKKKNVSLLGLLHPESESTRIYVITTAHIYIYIYLYVTHLRGRSALNVLHVLHLVSQDPHLLKHVDTELSLGIRNRHRGVYHIENTQHTQHRTEK